MAKRYFERSVDNEEKFGRVTVEGVPDPTTSNIDIPMGGEIQFPIVVQSESYLRNPYWFGKTNLHLYHLVIASGSTFNIKEYNSTTAATVSAFGHGIVFADFRDASIVFTGEAKTLAPQSWRFSGGAADLFNQVILGTTVTTVDGAGAKDLYLLFSEEEAIHADVFAIIKASKSKFSDGTTAAGTSTQNWSDQSPVGSLKTYYSLGNLGTSWAANNVSTVVQPIVFNASGGSLEIVNPNTYALLLETDGDMFLEFDASLASDTNLTVVLVRADSPRMVVNSASQLLPATTTPAFDGGIRVTQENWPYNRMDILYRCA